MKTTLTRSFLLLAAASFTVWGCWKHAVNPPTPVPSRFPQDVLQSCPLTSTAFNAWFISGTASENGAVMPANSITFPHGNNCDFYKWSQQMFLWITSPAPAEYGGGNTVLESPVFYTVSPQDSIGQRTFIPHVPNMPLNARSSITQKGPNDLPVILDKQGRIFEIESGGKALAKTGANGLAEIDHLERDAQGKIRFVGKGGKTIPNAKPVIRHSVNASRIVHQFMLDGKQVFVDGNGTEVETEMGQAGSQGALIAQNGSLVYYISLANDVYAYFLSGVRAQVLDSTTFPTDSASSAQISAYARQQGWRPAPDSNALAIELKTSWVETTNLPDSDTYITIDAIIPEYNTSSSQAWPVTGQRHARLALIGMHIVGSVAGHPEMIWATFEHNQNVPNAAYSYIDSNNVVHNVPADTGTHWLLNSNASATPVNVQRMKMGGNDTINAYNGNTIGASNTQLMHAFGVATNVVPNQEDTSASASNSEIISINNAVRNLLVGNDIRKNYYLVGATWTFGGTAPNGQSYALPNPVDTVHGVAIGTSQLANSTMETYVQGPSPAYNQSGSCFACHHKNNSLSPDALSHVFTGLQPLAPLSAKKK